MWPDAERYAIDITPRNRTMQNETAEVFKLRQAVATHAIKDPDFLEALKSDTQKALSDFTGSDFSAVDIKVVEEDGDTLVLPIPKISADLSAEQLEAVAGGAFFGFCTAATVSAVAGAVGGSAAAAGGAYAVGKSSGAW